MWEQALGPAMWSHDRCMRAAGGRPAPSLALGGAEVSLSAGTFHRRPGAFVFILL